MTAYCLLCVTTEKPLMPNLTDIAAYNSIANAVYIYI